MKQRRWLSWFSTVVSKIILIFFTLSTPRSSQDPSFLYCYWETPIIIIKMIKICTALQHIPVHTSYCSNYSMTFNELYMWRMRLKQYSILYIIRCKIKDFSSYGGPKDVYVLDNETAISPGAFSFNLSNFHVRNKDGSRFICFSAIEKGWR